MKLTEREEPDVYRNTKPGEAWNAAYAPDERRCRWPECDCYSPQGAHKCRRALTGGRDD